ncbi:oligosaccharide flippase family protein, partial [Phaeobacter sp. HF9A]|uniref:oligosaccharide flippase family protein n=1 Tax=Phaeobacter sp. HF9A TaxID=2721561 RepID=UPI0014303520
MTPASTGQSLMLRVLKSASWIVLNFGAAQLLRLASNLVLTRILFPEAFGLMALVTMVIIGLALFSDVGISNAIAQNPRGDDPEFLDTAWSLQLCRGAGLWVMTGLLALPAAAFYDAPEMAYCLPISGFALLLHGFSPTRVETAYRHLLIGRVTVINLGAQIIGLVCLSGLAYWSQSVVALAFGNVIQESARLVLIWAFLPGRRNQFRWHAETRHEIIGMGKWIFLSTAFYFMTSQGDRAILGKHLSLSAMGIYNIGFFLASFPVQIGQELSARLMLAVYRDKPAHAAPGNRKKQRQLRYVLSAGVLLMMWTMAWIGPWLVGFLYDARYDAAGA